MKAFFVFLAILVGISLGFPIPVWTQQDTTPPTVERTIPDLSEKVPTDLTEIRVVFSERMDGSVDVASYPTLPVSNVRWEDDNRTLLISFTRHLASAEIYRLILGGYGNIRDVAGNPLEKHILTLITEAMEPDTPAFVDMPPIHITGIEALNLSKALLARVSANPIEGFAFPYYLFIPQQMDSSKPVHLLVEPCNTGTTSDNLEPHERAAKSLAEASYANRIAKKLKVPLLVPVFPRPGRESGRIYTHALDRDTLLIREGDLSRIDMQLIKMIAHAQRLLRRNNVKVNAQVFMHGFSASGTFTNRFAILHPTVVRAVAAGGINGIPTFPTRHWNDTPLRYPVGIADVKEIAGIDFDEAAYKQVSQYIYMGALDRNDTIPYRDAYDEADAELVKRLIGTKMMPDRWGMSQSIYEALEIPAQFVTYKSIRHEIRAAMIDDIVAFFVANAGTEIVEIAPHEYPSEEGSEETFSLSASAVTESGKLMARGTFTLIRTDAALTSTSHGTSGNNPEPVPMYMLLHYITHGPQNLFQFPLTLGKNWAQDGSATQAKTTIVGYETVAGAAGTFPECLKHKTVFTDAEGDSFKGRAFVNGTRYLWFAQGIGLVKMRYEHANGITTEAELLEYDIPGKGQEYLPLSVGNMWTYKWQNDYRDEAVIEQLQVSDTPSGVGWGNFGE